METTVDGVNAVNNDYKKKLEWRDEEKETMDTVAVGWNEVYENIEIREWKKTVCEVHRIASRFDQDKY